MRLLEIYNHLILEAYALEYEMQTPRKWVATFGKSPDQIITTGLKGSDGVWNLSFETESGSYGQTNNNEAPHESMATVFQFITDLIAAESPEGINFSAAKKEYDPKTKKFYDSPRARIYARKANQMGKKLGYSTRIADKEQSFVFDMKKSDSPEAAKIPDAPKDRDQRRKDRAAKPKKKKKAVHPGHDDENDYDYDGLDSMLDSFFDH